MKKEEENDTFYYYNIKERIAAFWLSNYYSGLTITKYTSVTGFSSFDCIVQSGITEFETEIKVRKHFSTTYPDWLFEAQKIDNNFEIQDKKIKLLPKNISIKEKLFIIFFLDKVIIWDINQIINNKKFDYEMLRKHSVNGQLTKELKMVTRLLNKEAIQILDFKINHQKLEEKAKEKFFLMFGRNYSGKV